MINYPIKIKYLEIKNFRKFENISIEFSDDHMAVIAGKNGTGKTSILEAIDIAFSEKSAKFMNIKESDFNNEKAIEIKIIFNLPFFFEFVDKENSEYSGLIPCWGFSKIINRRSIKERNKYFSAEYEVKTEYDIKNFSLEDKGYHDLKSAISEHKPRNSHLVRDFKINEDDFFEYKIQSKREDGFRALPINLSNINYETNKVLFPQVFYFDKNRDREILPHYNSSFSNIVTELNWRFKRELLKDGNILKKEKSLELYNEIHQNKNSIDGYFKKIFKPTIDVMNNEFNIDACDNLNIFLFNFYQPYTNSFLGTMSDSSQGVSISEMGSGISIMFVLSLLISFSEESKTPLIIIIDEPELHLHADLQKKIFNFLNNKEFQSILSTHSHLFLDKKNITNNYVLENDSCVEIDYKNMSKIDLADLQFRLLGNSIDDIYIPKRIIIVEGDKDKNIIKKCLNILNLDSLDIQIIPAGGHTKIPDKIDRYDLTLSNLLNNNNWYGVYINKHVKIIIDGDVSTEKINYMAERYRLDVDSQIFHIDPDNQYCIEYLFPESMVRQCIGGSKLKDGTMLADKNFVEIIKTILKDDKNKNKNNCMQTLNRVSKSRLNEYVVDEITLDIINSGECLELKKLLDWISLEINN